MEDVSIVSEIITKFFLNICRMSPQLSNCAVQGTLRCCELATKRSHHDDNAYFIPLTTGSVAEFYILTQLYRMLVTST